MIGYATPTKTTSAFSNSEEIVIRELMKYPVDRLIKNMKIMKSMNNSDIGINRVIEAIKRKRNQ